MARRRGTEPSVRRLPPGVEMYELGTNGRVAVTDRASRRDVDPVSLAGAFLRFIDDGQVAHYLLGDPGTSPDRPNNATVKLGVVRPRSAFTPHAHGGEHVVLSLGYSSCGLYDADSGAVVDLALTPGMMIRIPSMLPHAFGNRAATPLVILAANSGYGIDHPDYAVTAAEAERRVANQSEAATHAEADYERLARQLRLIEQSQQMPGMTGRERVAAWLRRCADRLESDDRGGTR